MLFPTFLEKKFGGGGGGGGVVIIFQRNVSFREYNVFVSAITFEGFKLRSSNLTHALLIQISRTSLIIDIVVPSKMAAAAILSKKFNQKKVAYRSEMARNAIESDIRTSKMATSCHFVKNLKK